MNPTLRTLSLALVSLLLVACGRKEPAPAAHSGGHVHTAPHGGMLIELGDHAYNLELLRDPASGKITVWVLDGHAENFVRIKAAAIEASVTVGGERNPSRSRPSPTRRPARPWVTPPSLRPRPTG